MQIECAKCGLGLRLPSKSGRKFAKAQGWTWMLVQTDLYWRCWKCGPHV
jgi:hypothetical protein